MYFMHVISPIDYNFTIHVFYSKKQANTKSVFVLKISNFLLSRKKVKIKNKSDKRWGVSLFRHWTVEMGQQRRKVFETETETSLVNPANNLKQSVKCDFCTSTPV